MIHPRRITLNEYLGIVEDKDENEAEPGPSTRAGVLSSQKKWWDLFYRRNENRFFKDRHWTLDEFEELSRSDKEIVLFEAGCGVGNFLLPLMEVNSKLTKLYGCDISQNAVELLKKHPTFDGDRCTVFQCDLLDRPCHNLHSHVPPDSVDFCTLIFVLSAIPPEAGNIARVLANIQSVVKPGGILLFRDYAEGDHAQSRFEDCGFDKRPLNNCDKCFVRRDNTLSYFFTIEEANRLFVDECGFELIECCYIFRETTNRKENVTLKRKFIQGRYKRKSR